VTAILQADNDFRRVGVPAIEAGWIMAEAHLPLGPARREMVVETLSPTAFGVA